MGDERGGAIMTKEQIITGLIDCLDHQLNSGMGHMQDKYYKGEFFQLLALVPFAADQPEICI
jgi:hypothetical protein